MAALPTMEVLRSLKSQELWHQLCTAVDQYVSASHDDLEEFCTSFLFGVEVHFNRVSWALIATKISKTVKDPITFLQEIRRRFREKESSRDAWTLLTLALAQQFLRAGRPDEAEELVRLSRELLGLGDPNVAAALPRASRVVKDDVLSLYYEVLAEKAQLGNDALKFYQYSLHYLSHTPTETIPLETQRQLAFSLGIAALLGKDLYSFGELLVHPVFESLKGSPFEWMYQLLSVFNEGDLQQYERTVDQYKEELKSQPSLLQNHHILRDKIRIASFIALVFSTPADQRVIPFAVIAGHTKLSLQEIEFLVMKSLALGLIRGKIDQVAQCVRVDYVAPRMLAMSQIEQMRGKIAAWGAKVGDGLHFLDLETAKATPLELELGKTVSGSSPSSVGQTGRGSMLCSTALFFLPSFLLLICPSLGCGDDSLWGKMVGVIVIGEQFQDTLAYHAYPTPGNNGMISVADTMVNSLAFTFAPSSPTASLGLTYLAYLAPAESITDARSFTTECSIRSLGTLVGTYLDGSGSNGTQPSLFTVEVDRLTKGYGPGADRDGLCWVVMAWQQHSKFRPKTVDEKNALMAQMEDELRRLGEMKQSETIYYASRPLFLIWTGWYFVLYLGFEVALWVLLVTFCFAVIVIRIRNTRYVITDHQAITVRFPLLVCAEPYVKALPLWQLKLGIKSWNKTLRGLRYGHIFYYHGRDHLTCRMVWKGFRYVESPREVKSIMYGFMPFRLDFYDPDEEARVLAEELAQTGGTAEQDRLVLDEGDSGAANEEAAAEEEARQVYLRAQAQRQRQWEQQAGERRSPQPPGPPSVPPLAIGSSAPLSLMPRAGNLSGTP
ncbi:putative 26S proteasome non-ATPase regulatory subunit 13 A [Paratrimastix pyriformis]|uniref:26S proteasome non-ATPase regulatory subunit 13 A n=1 Tax=Paratrimastix pyriformis TaxID=342808 RepID=A0ABQ8UW10_9EUKA|nr:putative 26S proteasome non-ATPase regulatory subunit 13 A [Paratrimastix pyriformis]